MNDRPVEGIAEAPPRHLTDRQYPKITSGLATELPVPRLAIALMLYAGLRVGETVKLAWCDLVHGRAAKAMLDLDANQTKGNVPRSLPISRTLAEHIQFVWDGHAARQEMTPANYALARVRDGTPISIRQIERRVAILGRRELGTKLTPHMLRHTFATRLMRQTDIRSVQTALGHKSVQSTQIYTHVDLDRLRSAMDTAANADNQAV